MSYAPHVACWAQRGRALTSELVAGNREKLSGRECATIATRAIRLLPARRGPVTIRIDSAYPPRDRAAYQPSRRRRPTRPPRNPVFRTNSLPTPTPAARRRRSV